MNRLAWPNHGPWSEGRSSGDIETMLIFSFYLGSVRVEPLPGETENKWVKRITNVRYSQVCLLYILYLIIEPIIADISGRASVVYGNRTQPTRITVPLESVGIASNFGQLFWFQLLQTEDVSSTAHPASRTLLLDKRTNITNVANAKSHQTSKAI